MSSNTFIPIGTSYYSGLYDENGLTIAKADQRYIRIGGNGFMSSVFANTINATDYQVNGVSADLSAITNITAGVPTANKSLILNSNNQITDQLRFLNTNLRIDRTVNGSFLQSVNGTSIYNMFHFNNGSVVIGTSSSHTISFQTSNQGRLTIDSAGAVSVAGALSCSSLTVGGQPISTLPIITPTNATINGNATTGMMFYSSLDRFYGQRFIGFNSYSLLSLSSGGTYNDVIVYNHVVAPANNPLLSINCPMTTLEINTRSVQNVFNGGTNTNIFLGTYGSETQPRSRWFHWFRQATDSRDSFISIENNSSEAGYKIGSGLNSSGNRACVMSIGGLGDPAVNPFTGSGLLHLGNGPNVSVPANWRYSPTGASSTGSVNVNVSLFCASAIWVTNSLYATSDRRMKTDITYLDDISDSTLKGILNLKPAFYKWKSSPETTELGLIAQDLVKEGLSQTGLIQLFKNELCDTHCDETDTPAGEQFVVDYTKLPLYLLQIIKRQQKQIDELAKKMDSHI
jgi:hypothetical protein